MMKMLSLVLPSVTLIRVKRIVLGVMTLLAFASSSAFAVKSPHLLFNAADVAVMKKGVRQYPAFKRAFAAAKANVDPQLGQAFNVPVPVDAGGGFTHEQHKRNYKAMRDAGLLYQLTKQKKYAQFVTGMLLEYAKLYPTLGEHPAKKEEAPGRLFWQSLNEAVWLVYTIQAYDAVLPEVKMADRKMIGENVFRKMVHFLADESPRTFNRIHNHGTWAAAAVGMTGYVLEDKDMVEKALYGLDKSGNAGFMKQLDLLFSPDGYYTEGPYYQRYALMPFVLFGQAIEKNEPQRKIFEYRDNVLMKAVYTTIQLSYNGLFFPLNDAIKDKGLNTQELIHAVAIAYGINKDPALLTIAQRQNQVDLSAGGVLMARDLARNKAKPFPFESMELRDGANGNMGALDIMRSGHEPGHQVVLMKNTSQGMVHGHFDKLSWQFYDNGHEVVADYGAARYLNVEAKYGGHYLPENDTWAKQTIAHNTLVVDETSHFGGDLATAEKYNPEIRFFHAGKKVKIASAQMKNAYPDVTFVRTLAMLDLDAFEFPLTVDVMRVTSDKAHKYDLPLHYQGQLMELNFDVDTAARRMSELGKRQGYQYLWRKATAKPNVDNVKITWLLDNRFYTHTSLSSGLQEIIFTQLGANDPNFNLRPESAFIQRIKGKKNHTFVSVLEPHGEYNPAAEYTLNSHSALRDLRLIQAEDADLIRFKNSDGKQFSLVIAYSGTNQTVHKVTFGEKSVEWLGFYHLLEN